MANPPHFYSSSNPQHFADQSITDPGPPIRPPIHPADMGGKTEAANGTTKSPAAKPDLLPASPTLPSLLSDHLKSLKLKTKQQELLIRVSLLGLVYVLAFVTRLFSVLRYESMIHEFDPYFNYRTP